MDLAIAVTLCLVNHLPKNALGELSVVVGESPGVNLRALHELLIRHPEGDLSCLVVIEEPERLQDCHVGLEAAEAWTRRQPEA